MKDIVAETTSDSMFGGWVEKGKGWFTPAKVPGEETLTDPKTGQKTKIYRWVSHEEKFTPN